MGNIKVSSDFEAIKNIFSESNTTAARFYLANQVHKDMEPFVPRKSGDLRDLSHIDADGSSINYAMPYASKLFYVQMTNYTTPGTGPHWDEVAKGLYLDDWSKVYRKGLGL